MDQKRHKANSATKYRLYFKLLHNKMKEYNIQPSHIFNMDEKSFLLRILRRSKRIFSKRQYKRGGVVSSLQDGSREWITVLACICSDGTPLSPSLIFQSDARALKSA
ncbi:uncharacterized protein SETTUDRAFT_167242 [Exserohilum turcica Et28A]|uniref:Uncharacterized protein n=1 Tax=Exserohilum turcicum (strain 28A) TaxID=671987 RepID=R0J0Q0_EXST2|nr:uncharacterized protein SETTUDRAFT_167242 [Exserohilum turcica Et28A]EOA90346.1 hypothetical protein SETTUDRAFT_167242 [Exserohilum turcica Et28A]